MVCSSCSAKSLEILGFVPHFAGAPKTKTHHSRPKSASSEFKPIPIPELRRIISERMTDQNGRPNERKYLSYCDDKVQPNATRECTIV